MKALRTKLSTYAIALFISCGFTAPSIAGSSDFSGIYGALWGSAGGAQIDGRHTDQSGETTEGQVGGVFPVAGYEIGFNLPLGDVFFLGGGHSWTQSGMATLAEGVDKLPQTKAAVNGQDANNDSSFFLKAKKP